MILHLLLLLSFSVNAVLVYFLFKAAKRMLELDDVIQRSCEILDEYAVDLRKTLTSGILEEHPEVASFHRRNQRALSDIEEAVKNLGTVKPKEVLPPRPPVVE